MTDEAPKTPPEPSPPEQPKSRLPSVLYWSAYVVAIAVAVGASLALGAVGLPGWAATIVMMIAIGFAAWYIEDSPLNPNRDLDRDPFNRGFFAVNAHMLRAWRLRMREVEWKETRSAELSPAIVNAFEELLGVDPEVSVEMDGLLWVAGERDWHGYLDPPRFVVVGFDSTGKVKGSDDLRAWPKRWRIPLSQVQGRWAS